MSTKVKPGSVTAVQVLLILIAIYQLFNAVLGLLGALFIDTMDMATLVPAEMQSEAAVAEEQVWAVYVSSIIAFIYGVAAIVLVVMVAKARPQARTATIGVNAVAGVIFLVLIATPVGDLAGVIVAIFAFVVVGLLFRQAAKAYFGAPVENPAVG
ncbi:hypothetical protein [Nocardiopsis sp. MG754419]|uniref:hypothetical protein n=1 Tax=Nocardiopsis sp. MG754419 TaxID=2259865 RepID=UPI001BA8DE82|nr:hypothetical protein [Nocardiopsis sp. MG754419]MBR8740431.1 hypothetical protein [Nocardiopsis sp. MG754419]